MDKIIEYVNGWYFSGKLPSMPITEAAMLVTLIVFFGNIKWDKWYFPKMILHYLIMFIPLVIGKAYTHNTNFSVSIVYTIVMAGYAFICGRKKLINTAIYFLTYWTAYFVGSAFAKSVVSVIFVTFMNTAVPDAATFVALAVIQPLIYILTILLMRKFPIDKYNKLPATHIAPVGIVAIFAVVIRILVDNIKEDRDSFISINEQNAGIFIFFACLFILLVDITCYFFCYSHAKTLFNEACLRHDLEKLKQSHGNSEELKLLESNMEEVRSIRHDIKNQLAYIYMVLAQKEYDQLEVYFNQLYKDMEIPLEFCDCDNVAIRNALNLEQYKAKQNNCKVSADLSVPKELRFLDTDISALLTNLIDNAIEAIVEDDCKDALIEVTVSYEKQCLYIKVQNPIADGNKIDQRKALLTRKDNAKLHGRGTKIIKKITDKYNGRFDYSVDDEKFVAEVFLIE